MTTNEPACVLLKRKGASHIEKILANKTFNEELFFWRERTKKLKEKIIDKSFPADG